MARFWAVRGLLVQVGLDISQAVKTKVRGIARYVREVLPHLLDASKAEGEAFDPVLYIRSERILRRKPIAELAQGFETRWMPVRYLLPGRGLQLFHSFGNYLPRFSRTPLTFTVHDFRVLDLEPNASGKRLLRNVARSAGLICLTGHGRSRLKHYFPDYPDERIAVVPHGVDHERFRPRPMDEIRKTVARLGLKSPYLLQLGSWFPHKNLELSIKAFADSNARREGFRLALVGGGASPQYRSALDKLARSRGVAEKIDWLENVPADQVPYVVSGASCLLQPSRYEGFALPLLEAMAAGTPGVVSDSTCLPEVSGGAWPVSAQDDSDAFAEALDAMTLDSERRQQAISAGIAHASQFTWESTARQTLRFFSNIVAIESEA